MNRVSNLKKVFNNGSIYTTKHVIHSKTCSQLLNIDQLSNNTYTKIPFSTTRMSHLFTLYYKNHQQTQISPNCLRWSTKTSKIKPNTKIKHSTQKNQNKTKKNKKQKRNQIFFNQTYQHCKIKDIKIKQKQTKKQNTETNVASSRVYTKQQRNNKKKTIKQLFYNLKRFPQSINTYLCCFLFCLFPAATTFYTTSNNCSK